MGLAGARLPRLPHVQRSRLRPLGAKGAEANDIAVLRDRVVTRGVLADVAAQLGVEALAPDHHITVAELRRPSPRRASKWKAATRCSFVPATSDGSAARIRGIASSRATSPVSAGTPSPGSATATWRRLQPTTGPSRSSPAATTCRFPSTRSGSCTWGCSLGEIFSSTSGTLLPGTRHLGLPLLRPAAALPRRRRLPRQPDRRPLRPFCSPPGGTRTSWHTSASHSTRSVTHV